jgi:hypothetical protein
VAQSVFSSTLGTWSLQLCIPSVLSGSRLNLRPLIANGYSVSKEQKKPRPPTGWWTGEGYFMALQAQDCHLKSPTDDKKWMIYDGDNEPKESTRGTFSLVQEVPPPPSLVWNIVAEVY